MLPTGFHLSIYAIELDWTGIDFLCDYALQISRFFITIILIVIVIRYYNLRYFNSLGIIWI